MCRYGIDWQHFTEPTFEKPNPGIVYLWNLSASTKLSFSPWSALLGETFKAIKPVQEGTGVLQLTGPIAHAVTVSDTELEIEDLSMPYLPGDDIPDTLPILSPLIKSKAVIAHPATDLQVIHNPLKLQETAARKSGTYEGKQILE